MGMIPLFGIGQASKSPYVTAKQITNLYCEVRPQGEKSALVAYGTPGLEAPLVDFGATPIRGGREFPALSVCFVVHRGTLYEVNNAGVATARGTLLTTSGRVSMSDNGVQVMIVDGQYGYIYNTSTNAFAQITDGDFPANPTTVTFLGRRFVCSFQGSGRFYCSDVDNGLSWDALNFANAETNPDPIIAVWTSNGQLALLGSQTTEYWGLSGAVDFPFALISGTATEWGLAATWSIAKYDNTMACLMKNAMGEVIVARIEGYVPKPISTPDMAAIINGYTNVADATAYGYMLGQHAMYVITFPSAGCTWMYDGSTGFWSSLKSYGLTRYRGEFAFPFLNAIVVADYDVGRLYRIGPTTHTDNGDTIEREIIGETIRAPGGEFLDINCMRVDMEVGVGLPGYPFNVAPEYMSLPGGVGDYASSPDSAALDIVGDIDIRAHIAATDYTSGTLQAIVGKWTDAGNQRSYYMAIGVTGNVELGWTTTGGIGSSVFVSIAPTVAFVDGEDYWIRMALDVDDGAGNYVVALYTSDDEGATWTLNNTFTAAGTTSIFAGTATLGLGALNAGTTSMFTGNVYSVEIYGSALAASFTVADAVPGASTVTSFATGEVYTLNGTATLVGGAIATPGANPQTGLSISRDNGKTWGAEMLKPMGPQGEYSTRVEWRRLGSPRVFTPKLRITDAVPVCIVSAALNPED